MWAWIYIIILLGIPATIFNVEMDLWLKILPVLLWLALAAGGYSYAVEEGKRPFTTKGTYVDGRGRKRCAPCKKIIFNDKHGAEMAAQRAQSYGNNFRTYYENGCGNWHLTSQS